MKGKRKKECECEFCTYKSQNINVLESHIRTHTGERPYKCE